MPESLSDFVNLKGQIAPALLVLLLSFLPFVAVGEVISVTSSIDTITLKTQKKKRLYLTNSDTIPLKISLSPLKGIDFSKSENLLKTSMGNLITDRQKAFNLWKLCSYYGFNKNFPYNSNLPDNCNSRALITFPYFMCGEKAGILIGLANMAGLKARRISLDGHEVAELFYDSKWHMFDADQAVVFFDEDHEVLSVEELATSPFRLIRKKNAYLLPHISSIFNYPTYRRYVKNYSQDSTDWISYPNLTDTMWSIAVKLNPQDSLFYRWTKKNYAFVNPNQSYSIKGKIKSSLSSPASYVKQSDSSFIFSNEIPYYIKRITVQSPDSVPYNLAFVTIDRISGDTIVLPFKPSIKKTPPTIEFDAPTGAQIYYKYQIRITGLTEKQVNRLKISTFFEFNPLTFPFLRSKTAIVEKTPDL